MAELSTLGSVIKTAYEGEANTNAFTDAEQSKLAGIEAGATADQTAGEILTALLTVDGAGSGLDADLFDGASSAAFLKNVVEDTTPQLGGSLDVNAQKIVSVSNGDIDIEPNGTGNVLLGNFTLNADATIGAGQDNFVLRYDHAAGTWGPEAEGAGTDADAIHDNVSGEIAAVTEKAAQLNNTNAVDVVLIEDSESSNAKKKVERWNLTGAYTTSMTIADDAVGTVSFGGNVSAGTAMVVSNLGTQRGLFAIRTVSTAFCTSLASSGITTTTGALTGTTGTDGNVTLSTHTDNILYLENRSGASLFFTITVCRAQHY